MHELSIVENIVKVVCDKLEEIGADSRVSRVRLKVGKMSTAVPDCLEFYFEFLKKDTPLESASLDIVEVPVSGRCRQCGKEFEIEEPVFLCPSCSSFNIEITAGRELLVDSIDVEE